MENQLLIENLKSVRKFNLSYWIIKIITLVLVIWGIIVVISIFSELNSKIPPTASLKQSERISNEIMSHYNFQIGLIAILGVITAIANLVIVIFLIVRSFAIAKIAEQNDISEYKNFKLAAIFMTIGISSSVIMTLGFPLLAFFFFFGGFVLLLVPILTLVGAIIVTAGATKKKINKLEEEQIIVELQ